ncbi:MAG TPA: hypothetical protein VJ932_10800 [Alkalispirochaeta sp.]|nr:hypothetical protein [Alkalispirochaeta sp.]
MRRFSLYRRGKTFYVRFWDEKTKSYTFGRSTRETDKRAALATAAYWEKHGFPDGTLVQETTDIQAILETARTASLEKSHVHKLVDILVERGMLVGATLSNDGPASELLVRFLRDFWTYETSPYVAEKQAYGQTIGRRHCEDSMVDPENWTTH